MGARLSLICFLLFRGVQEQRPPVPEKPPSSAPFVEHGQRQFPFYPGGKLQITGAVPGNFHILGWGRATVQIETETIIYSLPEDQAKLLSQKYPLQVRWTQTTGTIRTSGPPQSAAAMEVNVTLFVPKDRTDLQIHLVQGDLSVESVNGWIEATLSEGDLEAKSLQGYFSGTTQKGDLDIIMSGSRWDGLGFTAATRQGFVQLQLPAEYSSALQLQTHDGELSISYPEQLVDGEHVPLKVIRQKNGSSLTATVGAGGAPIRLQTTTGNIQLRAIEPKN